MSNKEGLKRHGECSYRKIIHDLMLQCGLTLPRLPVTMKSLLFSNNNVVFHVLFLSYDSGFPPTIFFFINYRMTHTVRFNCWQVHLMLMLKVGKTSSCIIYLQQCTNLAPRNSHFLTSLSSFAFSLEFNKTRKKTKTNLSL